MGAPEMAPQSPPPSLGNAPGNPGALLDTRAC
jgi:hypothetical protein